MKRQIIKTKPVQPYRVARIIIAVIAIIVVAVIAFEMWTKAHAAHAFSDRSVFALQDSSRAAANPPSPIVL